jgi:lipopolysaccharide export system permease protein
VKILDKYIFTTFLKTFASIFTILLLIFILQTVWLLISDLAGKDLDLPIIGKFLIYLTPTLIPMVLPLTILLTSIMVFGNFAENYEFAAMKSSGISLQRAMKTLSIFIVLLSIVAFFFANNAIPWSEFKFRNLRRNIAQENPSMAIAEGQFNEIDKSTNIKVDRKYGEEERQLENVTMHLLRGTKNAVVIKARRGELASSKGSNVLQLVLYDGNYYEDIQSKKSKDRNKKLHAKSHFEKYTMNIDLSTLDNVDYDQESIKNNYLMLNAAQLNTAVDSLSENYNEERQNLRERAYSRLNIADRVIKTNKPTIKQKDTSAVYSGEIIDIFHNNRKDDVIKLALSSVNSTIGILDAKKTTFQHKLKYLNKHEMSLHKKFVLAFACIILFFIGAPLGAIIRKGGFGLPIVFAIIIFISYHFIGIFAENSAEDGTIHPFVASWLSTAIMLPFGILLTRNATRDRGVFNTDVFRLAAANLFKRFSKKTATENLINANENGTILEEAGDLSMQNTILKNYILVRKSSSDEIEKIAYAVQDELTELNSAIPLALYKIKDENGVFLIHLPLKNSSDFIRIFERFSEKIELATGYWNIESSDLAGESLLFVRKYNSVVGISNLEQAYKIGEALELKKSENREQISFTTHLVTFNECFPLLTVFPPEKHIVSYEEPDAFLKSKYAMGYFSVLFLLNVFVMLLGIDQSWLVFLALVGNVLGFGYFTFSMLKKSKNAR